MTVPKSNAIKDLRQNDEREDSKSSPGITRQSFIKYLGAAPGLAALPTLDRQNSSENDSKGLEGEPLGLSGILPFWQIHLDFHTSPGVPSVEEAFQPSEFEEILKDASVNSIAIFAKCNQGMSYYPTKGGVMHPGLKCDLLGEMIEGCHKQGIRAVIYISTMHDQYIWEHHGDWRVRDAEGREDGLFHETGPLKARLGRICVNTLRDGVPVPLESVMSSELLLLEALQPPAIGRSIAIADGKSVDLQPVHEEWGRQ